MATAELSPASDLGNVDDNPKNFNLDLSDAYETSPEESSAVEPVAMPIPDMIDESTLPPDFGSDADLDISDIEVEGLGFEGLDLGGDREDVQADEADTEPAVETAAEPEIEFELEGDDNSPTVTEEPDTSIPEIENLGLEIEPSDDDR